MVLCDTSNVRIRLEESFEESENFDGLTSDKLIQFDLKNVRGFDSQTIVLPLRLRGHEQNEVAKEEAAKIG